MEIESKVCSGCKKFKSLAEFYRQGNRHESLCKECKKNSRKTRSHNKSDFSSEKKISSELDTLKNKSSEVFSKESLPNFDESLFNPEEQRRSLGISDDDMDLVVAYFRWHFEQKNKRINNKEEKK